MTHKSIDSTKEIIQKIWEDSNLTSSRINNLLNKKRKLHSKDQKLKTSEIIFDSGWQTSADTIDYPFSLNLAFGGTVPGEGDLVYNKQTNIKKEDLKHIDWSIQTRFEPDVEIKSVIEPFSSTQKGSPGYNFFSPSGTKYYTGDSQNNPIYNKNNDSILIESSTLSAVYGDITVKLKDPIPADDDVTGEQTYKITGYLTAIIRDFDDATYSPSQLIQSLDSQDEGALTSQGVALRFPNASVENINTGNSWTISNNPTNVDELRQYSQWNTFIVLNFRNDSGSGEPDEDEVLSWNMEITSDKVVGRWSLDIGEVSSAFNGNKSLFAENAQKVDNKYIAIDAQFYPEADRIIVIPSSDYSLIEPSPKVEDIADIVVTDDLLLDLVDPSNVADFVFVERDQGIEVRVNFNIVALLPTKQFTSIVNGNTAEGDDYGSDTTWSLSELDINLTSSEVISQKENIQNIQFRVVGSAKNSSYWKELRRYKK